METIEQLARISHDAQEKISKIESAKRRAQNGKKVGKAFKYRNSYSCPEKPSDYWWLYSKVIRMDDEGFLYTTEFQTDSRGDINIRFDHYAYHMQGHTQITASEFNRAWARILAKVKTVPDGPALPNGERGSAT